MTLTESTDRRTRAADVTATRLREWLLAGPAQLRVGAEAGGVAGTLNAAGAADYVYGEITGYYLHWLAGSHHFADARRAANADRALAWCERRYGAGDPVPTRIALAPLAADWRNDTEFCFDLAMLVGGLSAAAAAGLIEPPRSLLTTLLRRLSEFAAGDRLLPVAVGSAALPDRWSTRSGPFLVKAAARILSAARWVELPAALDRACRGHLDAFVPAAIDALADPLHPTLYFLEGTLALALAPARADGARQVLAQLLALMAADGSLPESTTTPEVRRSDILAQALRVGLWLTSASAAVDETDTGSGDGRIQPALDALADALAARVGVDGSIAFRAGAESPQINVWCAMFAEQALVWYAQRHTRRFDAAEIV